MGRAELLCSRARGAFIGAIWFRFPSSEIQARIMDAMRFFLLLTGTANGACRWVFGDPFVLVGITPVGAGGNVPIEQSRAGHWQLRNLGHRGGAPGLRMIAPGNERSDDLPGSTIVPSAVPISMKRYLNVVRK